MRQSRVADPARPRAGGTQEHLFLRVPGWKRALAACALLLCCAARASAHLGNVSYSDIDVSDRGVVLRVKYAAHLTPGYPQDTGARLQRGQILALQDKVREWMQETVEVRVAEGRCTVSVDNLIGPDGNDDLQAILLWSCPAEKIPGLRITFHAFDGLMDEWQNIVTVRFGGQTYSTVFAPSSPRLSVGEPVEISRETAEHPGARAGGGGDNEGGTAGDAQETASESAGTYDTLRRFFELGVEHIWTGYDHLLFLFGVLLGGGGMRRLFAIVTSFTVAHSITLALATLGLVQLPSGPVELIIALSIVYVAVENIAGWVGDRRALVTFVFGLIHGFGFAGILTETGLPPQGVTLPLLAFNLGVESGQLVVLAIVVPIMRLCLRGAAARPLTVALSCLIAIAGAAWAIERIGALL